MSKPNRNEEKAHKVAAIRTLDGTNSDDDMEDANLQAIGEATMHMMEDIEADAQAHQQSNEDGPGEWETLLNSLHEPVGFDFQSPELPASSSMEINQNTAAVNHQSPESLFPSNMETDQTTVDSNFQSSQLPGSHDMGLEHNTFDMYQGDNNMQHNMQQSQDNMQIGSTSAFPAAMDYQMQSNPEATTMQAAYASLDFPTVQRQRSNTMVRVGTGEPMMLGTFPNTQKQRPNTTVDVGMGQPMLGSFANAQQWPNTTLNAVMGEPMRSSSSNDQQMPNIPVDVGIGEPMPGVLPNGPLRRRRRRVRHVPGEPMLGIFADPPQMQGSFPNQPQMQQSTATSASIGYAGNSMQGSSMGTMNTGTSVAASFPGGHVPNSPMGSASLRAQPRHPLSFIPFSDLTFYPPSSFPRPEDLPAYFQLLSSATPNLSAEPANLQTSSAFNPPQSSGLAYSQQQFPFTQNASGANPPQSNTQCPAVTNARMNSTSGSDDGSGQASQGALPHASNNYFVPPPLPSANPFFSLLAVRQSSREASSEPQNPNDDQGQTGITSHNQGPTNGMVQQSSQPMEHGPQPPMSTSNAQASVRDPYAPPGPPVTWLEQLGGPSQERESHIRWRSAYEENLGRIRNDLPIHGPGRSHGFTTSGPSTGGQGNMGLGANATQSGFPFPTIGSARSQEARQLSMTWDMSGHVSAASPRRSTTGKFSSVRIIHNYSNLPTLASTSTSGPSSSAAPRRPYSPFTLGEPRGPSEPRSSSYRYLGGPNRGQTQGSTQGHTQGRTQGRTQGQTRARAPASTRAPAQPVDIARLAQIALAPNRSQTAFTDWDSTYFGTPSVPQTSSPLTVEQTQAQAQLGEQVDAQRQLEPYIRAHWRERVREIEAEYEARAQARRQAQTQSHAQAQTQTQAQGQGQNQEQTQTQSPAPDHDQGSGQDQQEPQNQEG
ncbi:hypothetical protein PHISCL_06061 [Aspergillus sclerotialis]|uniref:Uncharacterized protein n=1 Tax=Aspergillus sclerotialis TaxID=2070753 RepID=A0A3A2ZX32_9EURO|nr:hypothetical protein PHISCL_06061 [Aspergillus sclerotialis]